MLQPTLQSMLQFAVATRLRLHFWIHSVGRSSVDDEFPHSSAATAVFLDSLANRFTSCNCCHRVLAIAMSKCPRHGCRVVHSVRLAARRGNRDQISTGASRQAAPMAHLASVLAGLDSFTIKLSPTAPAF